MVGVVMGMVGVIGVMGVVGAGKVRVMMAHGGAVERGYCWVNMMVGYSGEGHRARFRARVRSGGSVATGGHHGTGCGAATGVVGWQTCGARLVGQAVVHFGMKRIKLIQPIVGTHYDGFFFTIEKGSKIFKRSAFSGHS